jgi:hypothetical protein
MASFERHLGCSCYRRSSLNLSNAVVMTSNVEAPVGESIQPDIVLAVQNAMIYKAVLLNKQLENQGKPSLELLDPIAPDASARAERRLVDLGTLDGKYGKLTREGIALLRMASTCALVAS